MRVGSTVPPETVVISSIDMSIVTVFAELGSCNVVSGKKLYGSDTKVTLDDIRKEFAGFDLITVMISGTVSARPWGTHDGRTV